MRNIDGLEISSSIPIPIGNNGVGLKKVLKALKVGESFLLKNEKQRQYVYRVSKQLGVKITIRETSEGDRVWRVE